MTDIEHPASTSGDAKVASVSDAFRALIEDGQTLVEAEIAYRKAQASFGLAEAKAIALFLVLGLVFGFFTLIAIVVGLLFALGLYVGVWGALAIVGGTLMVLAGLCLLKGLSRIKRAKSGLVGGETAP